MQEKKDSMILVVTAITGFVLSLPGYLLFIWGLLFPSSKESMDPILFSKIILIAGAAAVLLGIITFLRTKRTGLRVLAGAAILLPLLPMFIAGIYVLLDII
ncbi:MAG: hypothetical protein ACYTBZ_20120 [Planctomycetota bacterium]|jgi:hypothetical protein